MLLVPVKAFHEAKSRLAESVVSPGRAALARSMATAVLRAGKQLRTAVVCDDERVARWAAGNGAMTLWKPGRGLNGAVTEAVNDLGEAGFVRVVVAHGDLPLAQSFASLADLDGITLVPDRRGLGTNVISLPTGSGFGFSYGPSSFARHLAEAKRVGIAARVVADENLSLDIDTPQDLEELRRR